MTDSSSDREPGQLGPVAAEVEQPPMAESAAGIGRGASGRGAPWWHDAVFYQIYPRSFASVRSREGIGDLAGIISRLDHLVDLGVDALWLSPIFRSPQADHGYDVSDYLDIDPIFGTLADFDRLLAEAHARGLKVTIDLVPNHTSDRHEWFRAALAAGRGSPVRAMYRFRDGRGQDGELPPTEVVSSFGGPAWTRISEPDGRPGQWYFHLFAPEQPDLNWENPQVLAEFRRIWQFWLDRGVDGFRIDVADALTKDIDRVDVAEGHQLLEHGPDARTHEVWRTLRQDLAGYGPDRTAVGEVWVGGDLGALYARPDEFPLVFNFPFMKANWDREELRSTIDQALWRRGALSAPPTWVLESHDEPRLVTRVASDLEVGQARARAMALVLLSLPGTAFIYQGQELGLPNVDDLPDEVLQDPIWERSGHTDRGRDGCRVPIPWVGDRPGLGFTQDPGITPWLPQPERFAELSVTEQTGDPGSTLELYRRLLGLRREHGCLRDGTLSWLGPDRLGHAAGTTAAAEEAVAGDQLHYERSLGEDRIEVLVNLGPRAVAVPPGEVLARSDGAIADTKLPPDTAVWVRSPIARTRT